MRRPARVVLEPVGDVGQNEGFVLDLRFDRVPRGDLVGDVEQMAGRLFGGDLEAAQRYIIDNQGYLILQNLRQRGCHQPALIVADLPPRRQENLRKLYGKIGVVPSFRGTAKKMH